VSAVIDHRWAQQEKRWELQVLWEGYSREDASWEPFLSMATDSPIRVRAYVNSLDDGEVKTELLALLGGRRVTRKKARGRR
jgi:hypothetical protein